MGNTGESCSSFMNRWPVLHCGLGGGVGGSVGGGGSALHVFFI